MEARKYVLPSRRGEVVLVLEKLESVCRAEFGKPYLKFPHDNPVIEVSDERLQKHIENLKAFDRKEIQRIPTKAEQERAALEAEQAKYLEFLGNVKLETCDVDELKAHTKAVGLPLSAKGKELTKPQLLKALQEAVGGDKENEE